MDVSGVSPKLQPPGRPKITPKEPKKTPVEEKWFSRVIKNLFSGIAKGLEIIGMKPASRKKTMEAANKLTGEAQHERPITDTKPTVSKHPEVDVRKIDIEKPVQVEKKAQATNLEEALKTVKDLPKVRSGLGKIFRSRSKKTIDQISLEFKKAKREDHFQALKESVQKHALLLFKQPKRFAEFLNILQNGLPANDFESLVTGIAEQHVVPGKPKSFALRLTPFFIKKPIIFKTFLHVLRNNMKSPGYNEIVKTLAAKLLAPKGFSQTRQYKSSPEEFQKKRLDTVMKQVASDIKQNKGKIDPVLIEVLANVLHQAKFPKFAKYRGTKLPRALKYSHDCIQKVSMMEDHFSTFMNYPDFLSHLLTASKSILQNRPKDFKRFNEEIQTSASKGPRKGIQEQLLEISQKEIQDIEEKKEFVKWEKRNPGRTIEQFRETTGRNKK